MLFLYVLILIIALWGLHKRQIPSGEAALSKSQANMIKGIFVLLVFVSHVSQYLDLTGSTDFLSKGFLFIRRNIGQLVVVPFLFYSGFGLRCSIEQKGSAYLRSMPTKRILRIYLHAAIIITLFLLVSLVLGDKYSSKHIILGYLLWDSFGNSTWYIFAILTLYLFTWFSFSVLKNKNAALILCFALTASYCLIMSRLKESWWYNTVFAFWFGLFYPSLQPLFLRILGNSLPKRICAAVVLGVVILLLTRGLPSIPYSIQENLRAILTMLLIILLLERIEIGNRLLRWIGTHVFEVYLLQRLPMILLAHFGLSKTCIPLFICGSIIGTGLLVWLFSYLLARFDEHIFDI